MRSSANCLGYILPLVVWVYLHSDFSGGLRKTCVSHNSPIAHYSDSVSIKVVEFSTNRT